MLSVRVSAVDQFRPVQKLLDGTVQVKVSGGSFGQACVLDASSNLASWTPIYTTNFPGPTSPSTIAIIDTNAMAQPHRLYRARVYP